MSHLVRRLLERASWQAEKLFKARGWLRTIVWCTETRDGRQQLFETPCEVVEISDQQALAALCAELRADFAADFVRYAVAFPATATITLWATAVHVDIERRKREIVAIEAHDADARLHAQRNIVYVAGVPRLGALSPIEPAIQPSLGFLEVADDRSHLPTRSLPA